MLYTYTHVYYTHVHIYTIYLNTCILYTCTKSTLPLRTRVLQQPYTFKCKYMYRHINTKTDTKTNFYRCNETNIHIKTTCKATHIGIDTYTHTHRETHTPTNAHTRINTYTHKHTETHTQTNSQTNKLKIMHRHTHTHTQKLINSHRCIDTHTYTVDTQKLTQPKKKLKHTQSNIHLTSSLRGSKTNGAALQLPGSNVDSPCSLPPGPKGTRGHSIRRQNAVTYKVFYL